MNRNWGGGGGGWRFVVFLIVQMSIDGRRFLSTNLHGNRSMSKYDEFVFVSLFRVVSLSSDPLEQAIK